MEEGTDPLLRKFDVEDMGPVIEPVFNEPLRDMLLVTELLEAEELDLLKFSFELVGLPDECIPFLVAELDV